MAESTLANAYAELISEIGHELGYGRTSGSWDATQTADVAQAVKDGLHQFYYPPTLPSDGLGAPPHQWTFLRPVVAFNTVVGDYDVDLPDDFSGVEGDLTYDPGTGFLPIKLIGEAEIRKLRQSATVPASGRPQWAAVRPKTNAGTSGQRFELLLHPVPDAIYPLSYRTFAIFNKLTVAAPYPLGGAVHARTVLKSCLAVVEAQDKGARGIRWQEFVDALTNSVQHDRSQAPTNLGVNADRSDRKVIFERLNQVTVYGILR